MDAIDSQHSGGNAKSIVAFVEVRKKQQIAKKGGSMKAIAKGSRRARETGEIGVMWSEPR